MSDLERAIQLGKDAMFDLCLACCRLKDAGHPYQDFTESANKRNKELAELRKHLK